MAEPGPLRFDAEFMAVTLEKGHSSNRSVDSPMPSTKKRMVYLIAVLAVLHFFWLVKLDKSEPIIYAILFAIVLMSRWIKPTFANRFYAREKKSA